MSEPEPRNVMMGNGKGRMARLRRSSRTAVGCEALEGRELLTAHALTGLALPTHVVLPVLRHVTPVVHRVTPVVHRVTPVRVVTAPHRGLTRVTPPASSGAVQQAEQKLSTDLDNIAVRDNLPSAQVAAFQADVQADEAAATRKASASAIATLQSAYASEAAAGDLDFATLDGDAAVVLVGAGVPQNLIAQTSTDLVPLVTAPTVTLGDAAIIDADLVALLTADGTSA
jgi:hypothetical protein